MSNLVGIGLSQVPTNSMLGGMAYQDPDRVKIKKLNVDEISQINSEIADTAVDIFIYDTSKDSDGGAWRKRTSDTSWYNETLGTATRGTRREFPAVAVIVMQEGTLTIYDGDDPDLPMWMVFTDNNDTGDLFASAKMLSCRTATSIFMLNGIFVCGGKGPYHDAVTEINFLTDSAKKYMNNGYYYSTLNISQRESTGGYVTVTSGTPSIINNLINDVAMTVLPNAPVDSATGLPVPTIAVATDGGVSVIKDDGTVVDITASGYTATDNKIDFDHLNNVLYLESGGYPQRQSIPSSDIIRSAAGGRDRVYGGTSSYVPTMLGTSSNIVTNSNGFLSGSTSGLSILDYDSSQSQEMVAYATTSYNTGYMHGDIKGAFLSDTDTTNITGSELITNGTFSSDVSGWTASNGTITHSSGTAVVNRTGGSGPVAYQTITTVVGETYVLSGTVDSTGTGNRGDIRAYSDNGSTMLVNASGTDNQTVNVSGTFTATTTTTYIYFVLDDTGTGTFDNVSVRIAEEDRSVNNNGLSVYGTITKSAVATGADLVAYSGFSASNYLQQPYNSDLNFGTGDFSFISWVKHPNTFASNQHSTLISKINPESSSQFTIQYGTNSTLYLRSNASNYANIGALSTNIWQQIAFVRRSGVLYGYKDGNIIATNNFTDNISNNESLRVGYRNSGYAGSWTGSLALLRISSSAPSAEQIKKMYEDEKVLFQENAKATLYGSSDAVTALGYDEDTELLHVGTSAGRSDFQGLRRINNTTTAVTTAISASDDLIAEQ